MFASLNKPSNIFTPSFLGYRKYTGSVGNGSFNEINSNLGYHPDQAHIYFGDFGANGIIKIISFEIFTKNIIYVYTEQPQIRLSANRVKQFVEDFDERFEYSSTRVENILTTGITNRSLSVDFLAKALKLKDHALNGVFYAEKIGLHLFFENGYLSDFSTASGLEVWGRWLQALNPSLVASYELESEEHWGDNTSNVTKEVNIQARSLARVPQAIDNEYTSLHLTEHGLVNFRMLLVCHYDEPITMQEFQLINHGRYVELPHREGTRLFILGKFYYVFDSNNGEQIEYRPYLS